VFFPVYFLGVILGAGVGGFLHDNGSGSGAMVGGLAGILATIPFVIFLAAVFLYGFGWVALQDVPAQLNGPDLFAGTSTIIGAISIVAFIFNIIFGLIGGLIGGSAAS